VEALTGTQAIELDWLKGNKFHEGIGQTLHYGGVTGQQPVLALISAYYNIFGAEDQKLECVSGLCAAHGVEIWALLPTRRFSFSLSKSATVYRPFGLLVRLKIALRCHLEQCGLSVLY